MVNKYQTLYPNIHKIFDSSKTRSQKLQQLCEFLKLNISTYDWVGFYFKNGNKNELVLGPFAGLETDHKIIPFGKGICGQVALSNKNFVVADVSQQQNYIACNINVKSEIVIPLIIKGQNIGQIDIDSNTINAFDNQDERFLEDILKIVAKEF